MLPVLVNISIADCPPFPALLHDDRVLALIHWRDTPLRRAGSAAGLLEDWDMFGPALAALCAEPATIEAIAMHGAAVDSFRLHAPVAPKQVYCTIGNYREQVLQAALDAGDGVSGPGAPERRAATLSAIEKRMREGEPYICTKGSASVAGPNDDLRVAADLTTLDWEVEIGVVIGRTAWQVDIASALDHVAGYCVVNDLTLRENVFRKDPPILGTDWVQSKAQPGWLPVGPWLAPAWNVTDSSTLKLWLKLNGETMQEGVASDMLFGIAEQITYLSRHTRLEPRDLICTGSPAGFGSHYRRYLRPGDVIEAGVDGLGVQRVRCVP